MTNRQFHQWVSTFVEEFRKSSPIKTGNLRFNAIRYVFVSPTQEEVYIDLDVAPYMPYTNEPWISPKWQGHKNPNEGWFGKVAKDLAQHLAKITSGVVMEYVSFGD
jgi:hypothetical protein